jgi:hypothetical protein
MTQRHDSDEEVAAIFRGAAERPPQAPALPASQQYGLTLAQLQEIGREVGLTLEAVSTRLALPAGEGPADPGA